MIDVDTDVIVALIAAVSSIGLGVFSALYSKKIGSAATRENQNYQTKLAEFQTILNERSKEHDALVDYEYEARKKVYEKTLPILFQYQEYSRNAYRRILSLARSARKNTLGPNVNWLSSSDYYMTSTVYRLILPLAAFRILQKRLTQVDLELVPYIKNQYLLAKVLYETFSSDFDLKECSSFSYNPDMVDDDASISDAKKIQMRKSDPRVLFRQGLYAGIVDNLADALIVREQNSVEYLRSFGEFETEYFKDDKVEKPFDVIVELFRDFHPRERPILWMILLSQAKIYQALNNLYLNKIDKKLDFTLFKQLSEINPEDSDWRVNDKNDEEKKLIEESFRAVDKYLENKIASLYEF